jgi:hypothetical protein
MDWCDIETAPKDGRLVILGQLGKNETTIAAWVKEKWKFQKDCPKLKDPTHWCDPTTIRPPNTNDRHCFYVITSFGSYVVDEHSMTNMVGGAKMFSHRETAEKWANEVLKPKGYAPVVVKISTEEIFD